jgi:ketosteroid isomerase-like protein
MRLPNAAHTSRPWRIHAVVPDFRLEDVWALPTPGGPDDFPRLVRLIAGYDPAQSASAAVRWLFAIRWKVGGWLGWDGPAGSEPPTLRDRLPADLADGPPGPGTDDLPFSSLYMTDDEWAAEIVNRTAHAVMHIGWVADEAGGYRGQMAVLVKPNGRFGNAYMAAIGPFRHRLVYPQILRESGRRWRAERPVALIDALHAAQNEFYGGGSDAALRRLLTPDIVWTVPGASPIAGVYRGVDDVFAYFARRRDLATGTFRMHRRDVLVGKGRRVAALTDGTATVGGREHEWSTVGLYEVTEDGRISACWLLPLDQHAFDAVWSSAEG